MILPYFLLTISILLFVENGQLQVGNYCATERIQQDSSAPGHWFSGQARKKESHRLILEKLFLLRQKMKLRRIAKPSPKVQTLLKVIDYELDIIERELQRNRSLELDLARILSYSS